MTTSSAVHSQAFAFMSYLQGGVDPRTGQYTVSLDFPEIKSNWLHGPDFLLGLSFNPINILDSGFGLGWNLNLSQFTPHNSILALSTGETFKVTGSGTEPAIKEKKLDSFHFYNNQDGTYRVVHKSGLIEVLTVGGSSDDRVALPTRIYAPSGHGISLTYASFRGGQRLQTVSDAEGELLRINRPNDSRVELLIRPYGGPGGVPLARYEMQLNGSGWVTAVVLPTADKASWRFDYGNAGPIRGILCLHKVYTPVGGLDTIDYQDPGHPYPGGVTRPNLPRVTRHRSYPGFGQPMMEVNYRYTAKNFLGAGATVSWEEGMDPLYNVAHTYEYGTTATLMADGKAVRQVDRTFNRFHLLTEEKTTQDHCVKREATTYYAEDKPFEQQVPQFQLPRQVKTSWEMDNDVTRYREELAYSAFDTHGNQTEQVEPSGIRTVHTYYPKEASDGCPADPEGFVRSLKDTTVLPSPQGLGGAPTLRTRLRYRALDPLAGSGQKPWLTSESETLQQVDGSTEVELKLTRYTYNDEPGNEFLHGRPSRQHTTLNGKTSTTEYAYRTLTSVLAAELVLETVETFTGFDHGTEHVQKVITREDSLIHGQPLLTHDDTGVKIRNVYDELQRVISETVSPDDEAFKATRTYKYYLTSLDGQQAHQEVMDVKNVTTRTFFDGLNRAIREDRQNADSSTRADEYRPTWSARYDALENLVEETQYDWWGEEQVPLTSAFTYDAWGMQCCVTGPDGVQVHEQIDPMGSADWKGPIQRSWRQGAGAEPLKTGVTATYLNLFEKPTRIERFDADNAAISLHQNSYDGLGQTVLEIDAREARTEYAYDAFGRMTSNTLPGGAVVRRRYAEHSSEDLPIEISVDAKVLGEQVFDGLGRMKQATTGGRTQSFSYRPGQTQPKSVITASKQLIEYGYNTQLGEEPTWRQLPGEITADYVYDRQNARLVSCQEPGQGLERQYFSTGELKSEQRDQDGETYGMHYDYSRQGLLLSYTDVLGQTQRSFYDHAGRLESTELGTTRSSFTYDGLGQTATISTQDSASGQQVTISLEYDEFGRETKRTFDLNGTEQQLTQVYNEVDALVQRTLYEGDVLLRDETYGYDPRGRLTLYTCKGSQPPVDPYGKAIARQVFRFDALDNLTLVTTTSVEGTTNRATYTYGNVNDPTQLTKVENNAGAPYPAQISLEYDDDGHLTLDEEQRVLEYDALGRLIRISGLSGETPSRLGYDPLDTLATLAGGEGQEQRFYRDGELANRIQGADSSTFVRADGVVLAEHQAGAGPKSLLLASDFKNTVLSEISGDATNALAYSAYGHRSAEQRVETPLGYNGALREAHSGVYLLGNGYRAYSPILMRFHCPDSWSPFGLGGLNPYAYCGGEPIMNTDDSGHMYRPALPPRAPSSARPAPPPSTPGTQGLNPFRAKIAAQNSAWKQHKATAAARSEDKVPYADAPSSSSRSGVSGREAEQRGDNNMSLQSRQHAPDRPSEVMARREDSAGALKKNTTRREPEKVKPVIEITDEWSRKLGGMGIQKLQERYEVRVVNLKVGKVRNNILDSKKNSEKQY